LRTPRCSTKGSCLPHGPNDLIGKKLGQAQPEKPTLERGPPVAPLLCKANALLQRTLCGRSGGVNSGSEERKV
jgi:hypothetical protein